MYTRVEMNSEGSSLREFHIFIKSTDLELMLTFLLLVDTQEKRRSRQAITADS